MATEKRLIELDYVVDHLQPVLNDTTCPIHIAAEIDEIIGTAPTVDAVEVVHGKWILGNVEPGYFTPGGNRPWICSECGEVISYRLDKPMENYCPNCGAKMDGDGNGC